MLQKAILATTLAFIGASAIAGSRYGALAPR